MLQSYFTEGCIEAGCDEAGRGCLAGPVVAAAVILPPDFSSAVLNDSKQLTPQARYALRPLLEQQALAYGIGVVTEAEIDALNILNASFLAMHRAIEKLTLPPERLLIDGNRFKPYSHIPHHCIIKGDAKFAAIAAASVLAKTYRDDLMDCLHAEYPHYHWQQNKGYPTKAHRAAIAQYGSSPYHRQSFQLLPVEVQGALFP